MENINDREMHIDAILDAPIDKVWQAWADPKQIVQWWGPNGFTNTMDIYDLRNGGEWRFTMHGPDGKDYLNKSEILEIKPQRVFKFEHASPHFITTVLFEAKGNQTHIDWTMLFDSKEMRDAIIKAANAEEGLKQNIEKLKTFLAK